MGDELSVERTIPEQAIPPAGPSPTPSSTPPEHRDRSIRHLRVRVLSGSFIMLASSVFVGAVNFIYNFAIAHALGADNFGHASVLYTVLLLLSAVTLSFQLVCSKFLARTDSPAEKTVIYR